MQQLLIDIVRHERRFEELRQELAMDPTFSLQHLPDSMTLVKLHQMFGLDLFPIFERLDTDNDGKLTANDLVEFAMPRQPEYRALKKSPAGHWKRLIELLSLANECEGWLRKQVPQIHLEFPDLPLKKYLSNRFYRFSEKDLWYLNNRVGCEKVQDLRADLEAYVLSE